ISSSPGDLKSVFHAILENATRICEAKFGTLLLFDGACFRVGATFNVPAPLADYQAKTGAFVPPPGLPLARLVETKKVAHMLDDPEGLSPATKLGGARTHIAVPMLKEGKIAGAIYIYRQEVKPFAEKQIELVENFAAQAVIAIENARLLNELRESLDRQTATSEGLSVISSSPGELEPVFQTMLENATRICDAKFGVLYLYDDGKFRPAALAGPSPEYEAFVRERGAFTPHPNQALAQVLQTKAVLQRSAATHGGAAAFKYGGARAFIAVPMLKENKLVGAINIFRQEERPFTDKQIALLQNFAAQAVIAIENARLLSELHQRTADLTESLERQTATSEVLRVISSSTFDLEKVFGTLLETAMRLCESTIAGIWLADGDQFKLAAARAPSDFVKFATEYPVKRSRGTVTGRTALEGKLLHIPDVLADPEYTASDYQSRGQYRSALGVPLLRQGETIGVFTLSRSEAMPFNTAQIELVQNFAAQAVVAVENTRLLNDLRQPLQQQPATAEVLKVISRSTFDLQTVLDTLMESAARLCQADKGAIMQQDGEVYRLASNYGLSREAEQYALEHPLRPDRGSMTGRVALEGGTIHIPDVLADPEYQNIGYQKVFGYRTDLGVPLLREGTTIGIFSLTRDEVNPFTEKQIELATTFADQAVIAIENARLLNELRESLK